MRCPVERGHGASWAAGGQTSMSSDHPLLARHSQTNSDPPPSSPSASTSTRNLIFNTAICPQGKTSGVGSDLAAADAAIYRLTDSVVLFAPVPTANETACPTLVFDVLRQVMRVVEDKQTLHEAALVSRTWACDAVAVLWRNRFVEKCTSATHAGDRGGTPVPSFDRFVETARKTAFGGTTYGELVRKLLTCISWDPRIPPALPPGAQYSALRTMSVNCQYRYDSGESTTDALLLSLLAVCPNVEELEVISGDVSQAILSALAL
ncbi:hypothetical protein BDK51DRAFT_48075 [Blyttiomyces helicus]|uniref:Uncharacterized protein n=1 Tax=Blyttiomyces helicus TaxID=388810 RepID=A0A4V1IRP1_9FUNG|nr:hypothetical protein BDK51DRAFT_48075 [Blyttiomyces helicus]|eukprot:RKO90737.1 hypothetical protein BDK51DRAFT_48075 [Blyttiomyces helicus]